MTRAASPFDTLVAALDTATIEGEDSTIAPLAQRVLDRMVADPKAVAMSAFIQRHFKLRGSNDTLSDRDSGALATKAVMLLSSGAFLLQWVGLVLYVGFSSSPTGGVSWPTFPFFVVDINAARRSLYDLPGTAVPA